MKGSAPPRSTVAVHPLDVLGALARAEAEADAAPGDRAAAARVVTLADRAAVEADPPDLPAGLTCEALVRWDASTAVWRARRGDDTVLVRALRPAYARNPVWERIVAREGRALAAAGDVALGPGPILVQPAPGRPLGGGAGDHRVRALLTGLAALERRERAGLGVPALALDELRVDARGVHLVCLVAEGASVRDGVATLLAVVGAHAPDEDEVIGRLRDLVVSGAHHATVDDVATMVRRVLAEVLTEQRHSLAARWRDLWHYSRRARLRAVLDRLARGFPAPEGRGAVGVDLDGRITVVEARRGTVWWGPEPLGAAELVFDPDEGFRPPIARRLLRARAMSPPNPTLDARVGGDPAATDALCRWVAAGLHLRTLALLLAPEPA